MYCKQASLDSVKIFIKASTVYLVKNVYIACQNNVKNCIKCITVNLLKSTTPNKILHSYIINKTFCCYFYLVNENQK